MHLCSFRCGALVLRGTAGPECEQRLCGGERRASLSVERLTERSLSATARASRNKRWPPTQTFSIFNCRSLKSINEVGGAALRARCFLRALRGPGPVGFDPPPRCSPGSPVPHAASRNVSRNSLLQGLFLG